MEQANRWSKAPWEVTGEELTRWRRYVWRARHDIYYGEIAAKQRRQRNDMELKRLQNGR